MTRKLKEIVNHHHLPIEGGVSTIGFEPDHVVILLALFNGAETLGDQLESISKQHHRNWSLIISDDGSTDDWHEPVDIFAAQHKGSTCYAKGPQKGSTQNFLGLIQRAGPLAPFAALCDQDDAWLPSKLTRALYVLRDVSPAKPALYVAPTFICDQNLKPLRRSICFQHPPSFANALVQSIGGGNTMVLNRAALDLVQETARHASGVKAHDWWIYQIITGAGGIIKYDPTPLVLYRQHKGNQIGANDTLLAGILRLRQLLKGRFRDWNSANASALEAANHWLTPEARHTLADFKTARTGTFHARLKAVNRAGLYRQTRKGQIALWISALLKKL